MGDIVLIAQELFKFLNMIFNFYTVSWLTFGILALWLLRRVVNLYKKL